MLQNLSKNLTVLFLLFSMAAHAQNGTVKGTVRDANGPLAGATVQVERSNRGGYTNAEGQYSLSLPAGKHVLNFSYIGLSPERREITVVANETVSADATLIAGSLNELVVLGSRALPRTQTETPVPVDVIDVKRIVGDAPQVYVNQILNYIAPSFSSGTQTVADGTDHIDPASLRGLGPDQVLVLVNGKRRYNSAIVNVNGTFGRGAVGTDMNAIPTSAIDRIEILRDGAAAQYGSDAIAGVINIILRSTVNRLSVNVTTGANATSKADGLDGETVQTSVNYGIPVGSKGGYVNLAGSYDYRNYTNRAGDWEGALYRTYPPAAGVDKTDSFLTANNKTRADFKMRVGQSAIRGGQFFLNSLFPMENGGEVYAFGGIGYRNGQAAGFRRLPHESRNVLDIYPMGFLPEIHSDIYDKSLSVGIRGDLGEWKADLSNTFGQNKFIFSVVESLNASLEKASPTAFEAGGPTFTQNTSNLDLSRRFDVMDGLNLGVGAEYRFERYQLVAGEENSYADYGRARKIGVDGTGKDILVPDFQGPVNTRFGPDGVARPGGAQVFPGFRPENAVNAARSAVSAYLDVEANLSSKFLIGIAGRFENYSDFGSTLNGKLTTRYKLSDGIAIRASASTGFRAPSLHQRFYSTTSTLFVDGIPYEVGTFTNDSRPAQLLGIPKLKPETAKNFSAGFTGRFGKFNVTLDGYFTHIEDRIVYTDQFSGSNAPGASPVDREIYELLSLANANRAAFFANAINSETKGVDLVVTYSTKLGGGTFRGDLAGTWSGTTRVGPVKASPKLAGKENIYFSEASRIYLERSVPRQKVNLSLSYNVRRFNVLVKNVYFGPVEEATTTVIYQQEFDAKVITDIALGFKITKEVKLSIGANNLLDVYPEEVALAGNKSNNQFIYSRRATQFGFNGRFIFARIELSF
ncbi:TonB-dependent receptor [Chitinophaga sp. SYP-B3965]|uniref:TonB-dependent receptor n=1 Tax=Chitinophaga sp. SYP-B3965 TaxID=2663120 RepID=UPI001299D271|nr:TonB-dependent receptor [Chitinophaga sp. SYP-B3965]MRG43649.1 TonB-dependent receptor [Chitinophaga sp. SYP-B3965]